jgi:uncharacterized membrane protein
MTVRGYPLSAVWYAGRMRDLPEHQTPAGSEPRRRREDRMLAETSRVEAFSDGVFAIAATLLVLTLTVPTVREAASGRLLWHELLDRWPTYFAFVVSFISILVMWASHHNIFTLIRRVDHTFLLINGVVLMGVTVIPFPTELLAQHLGHPGEHVAAAVYSAVALIIALGFNALWYWARRDGHLLEPDIPARTLRLFTRQYAVGPLVYLAAFGVSFFSAWGSLAIFVLVLVFYAVPTPATAPLDSEE